MIAQVIHCQQSPTVCILSIILDQGKTSPPTGLPCLQKDAIYFESSKAFITLNAGLQNVILGFLTRSFLYRAPRVNSKFHSG